MIGQTGVIVPIERMIDGGNFPSCSMLIGPEGHGKRTLVKEVMAPRMKASIFIPDDLKVDSIRKIIEDGQSLNRPRIYLLSNANEMTIQAQNALLKFAEEPPKNAYIVLTLPDESVVLPTIQSRSKMFRFEGYTKDQLKQFTDDPFVVDIAENPGQIMKLKEISYEGIIDACQKVVDNIHRISAANAFSIMNHFEENQYEYIISTLLFCYNQKLKKETFKMEGLANLLEQLKVVYKFKDLMKSKSINKVNALEIMFAEMREVAWNFNH